MGAKDKAISSKSQQEQLKEWYRRYRTPFMKQLSKQMNLSSVDVLDIFQESIIILYERVFVRSDDKPIEDHAAYLYGIGKHLAYKKMKKEHRPITKEITSIVHTVDDDLPAYLKAAVQSLGSPCKDILELFYYHRYAIESIQERLNYKSATVVRVQKGRCIEQLRKKIVRDV